jgi:hypothetical protein
MLVWNAKLLHRRRRLLQAARLLLGTLAQVRIAVGDLGRAGGDRFAGAAHVADDADQVGVHQLERAQQRTDLVRAIDHDGRAQVAVGDGARHRHGGVDAARHGGSGPRRRLGVVPGISASARQT